METIVALIKMSSADIYATVLRMPLETRAHTYYLLTGEVKTPTWKEFEFAVKIADLRLVKRRWLVEQIKTASAVLHSTTGEDRICLQNELKELRKELKNGFTES